MVLRSGFGHHSDFPFANEQDRPGILGCAARQYPPTQRAPAKIDAQPNGCSASEMYILLKKTDV